MASTILQNLPAGGARTARSAGRQAISSDEKRAPGGGFDQALRKSVDRTAAKPQDDNLPVAQKPSAESRRPAHAQPGNQPESDALVDDSAPAETAAEGKPVEKKEAVTDDAATGEVAAEPVIQHTAAIAESGTTAPHLDPSLAFAGAAAGGVAETEVAATAGYGDSDEAVRIKGVLNAVRGQPGGKPAGLHDSSGNPQEEANADTVIAINSELASTGDNASTNLTTADAALVETPARPGVEDKKVVGDSESASASEVIPQAANPEAMGSTKPQVAGDSDAARLTGVQASQTPVAQKVDVATSPSPVATPLAPEKFADANHPTIVSTVRGQLLPSGGTMQIRLDPPELGALLVQVSVRDGVIDASFQTSNADATQLLSHSLTQLKHSLESQGVTVDKLQVSQAPRSERADQQNDPKNSQQQGQNGFDWERHSNQQRKEMLKRMWAKLGAGDPLDLVA